MIRARVWSTGLAWALVVGLVLVTSACASASKKGQVAKTGEAAAQGAPSGANEIEYIDLAPWVIHPGESAQITVAATRKREASVLLVGVEGQAAGRSRTVALAAKTPGVYAGTVAADDGLPPGKYRVEVTIAGGPSGQPVTLVSSRGFTVAAAAPQKGAPAS